MHASQRLFHESIPARSVEFHRAATSLCRILSTHSHLSFSVSLLSNPSRRSRPCTNVPSSADATIIHRSTSPSFTASQFRAAAAACRRAICSGGGEFASPDRQQAMSPRCRRRQCRREFAVNLITATLSCSALPRRRNHRRRRRAVTAAAAAAAAETML